MKPVSSSQPQSAPGKRRSVPRPSGYCGTLFAALVLSVLPFCYLVFLAAACWGLVYASDLTIKDGGMGAVPLWMTVARASGLAIGWIVWASMFKPILMRPPRPPAFFELKKQSQPECFATLASLCTAVGGKMPARVLVDGGMSARQALAGFLGAWLSQKTVLTVGLPLAASCSAKELAGELANALGRYPKGFLGRLLLFVSGMNRRLQWVATQRDAWSDALAAHQGREKKKKNSVLKRLLSGFLWITLRPVAIIAWVARIVSRPALRAAVFNGDRCEAAQVGTEAFLQSLRNRVHLMEAWERGEKKLQEGVLTNRLPDNFPQMVARLASGAKAAEKAIEAWNRGTPESPGADERAARAQKKPCEGRLDIKGNGSIFFADFQDIGRLLSQAHYQNDLGFDIRQFRLTSGDETRTQDRQNDERLLPVKRYFRGLCHSERALCTMHEAAKASGAAAAAAPPEIEPSPAPPARDNTEAFIGVIDQGREWLEANGNQMRALVSEWHMAWQRMRDLEMANTFALADLPMDSHQYGVAAHRADLYREEIERQRFALEHSDEALSIYEARLEARFAAALGLLWETDPAKLPDALREQRALVPGWVALYQTLAERLPLIRRIMTHFGAYGSLGAKFSHGSTSQPYMEAVGHLVPPILCAAQQVLHGLDKEPPPPGRQFPSLAHALLHNVPANAISLLALSWNGPHASGMKIEHAVAAGELVEPLLDRFLELHHQASAILATAAEACEDALVDEPRRARQRSEQVRHTQLAFASVPVAPAAAPALV